MSLPIVRETPSDNPNRLLSRAATVAVWNRWWSGKGISWAVLWICLTLPLVSFGGSEYTRESETLRLAVDSRWPGNAHGGYIPLRINLKNFGPEQDFKLVFKRENPTQYDRMPEVRRTVHLMQNENRDTTLPIPIVGLGNTGELFVYDSRGQEIESLKTSHSLPAYGGDNARTSLLVIASDDVDDKQLVPFEDAAATECASLRGLLGSGGYSASPGGQITENDHLIIPPTNIPENWTDYSGIDLIAISWPDFSSKLKSTSRDALLKWAACGGTLIVYNTEKPASELTALHQALQLDEATGKAWKLIEAPMLETTVVTAKSVNMTVGSQRRYGASPPGAFRGPQPPNVVMPQPVEAAVGRDNNPPPGEQWPDNANEPTYRDWSFGRIYVFPKSPFPGTTNDWTWLLASMPQHQTRWSSRMGMSARVGTAEFLNFLIPGVGSVPVHAFLVLITIFTVVIGPLNYYWLRKQRRLGALVFTVPAIAAVACLLLFVYSLVADGFSVRSRIQSVTFLDQQAKSASSISRVCLYAPFAPSAGLRFSPNVAAFPIWPQQQRFEGGVVDWTENEQHLTSGWFRSQTWTQFMLIESRDERGRLDFTPPASPQAPELTVSNGFSWDLVYLAVEPTPGTWYVGENVSAGATAQLKMADTQAVSAKFSTLNRANAWELPAGMQDPNQMPGGMGGRGGYPGGRYSPYGLPMTVFTGTTPLSDGQMRRYQNGATAVAKSPTIHQSDWRNGNSRYSATRHSEVARPHYWAVCGQNPGVETGVKKSLDQRSYHLLFGVF